MKDLFIPFKESQEMKELGFDEPCLATYHKELHTIIPIYAEYTNQDVIKAHLYTQAFKWFRDNHKLHSGIYPYYDEYEFQIKDFNSVTNTPINGGLMKYEEAELECLRQLIKIAQK